MTGFEPGLIAVVGLGVVVLFVVSWMVFSLYQKCSPNQAMIISGMWAGESGRAFKIVVGGGAVVVPMVQQRNTLSLEIMTIEVHSQAPMITRNGVPLFVDGVAQVKVKSDETSIATAAERFLGKTDDEISNIAHESLVGHLRAILGTMTVEDLIQSFDAFAQRVQEVSAADLSKMGLCVDSFTIKEIKDTVGYLEALGRQQTAETKRTAEIGVAHATKETQIAQAQAQRDAQIAQAQAAEEGAKAKLAADTRVAEASKNYQVSQASYAADVAQKKAASDMMYEIVKAQTEQKLVEERQKVKIVEAQKEVELQQVEVQKKQVSLEQDITKPAEAEQMRIRLMAQAEQEKRKLLAEGDAQAAKLQAQGQADATRLRAIAEAEATKATGLAQAEAQRARGLAEATVVAAKGQAEAEAMMKKAEAYKQYNDAAIASMIVDKLPDMVQSAAAPLSKIQGITMISSNGDSGMTKISTDVLNVAAQSFQMIKGLTGIDITESLKRKALSNESVPPAVTAATASTNLPPNRERPQG